MAEPRSETGGRAGAGTALSDAFDPALFRAACEVASERLAEHLGDASIRGLELTDPEVLLREARALMAPDWNGGEAFDEKRLAAIIDLYIRTGIQVHSPGYMGRQFSGVVPLAGVVELVSSVVNQPSSFYEAAQLPNVAERIMAEELNRFIGWDPERFAMVTTSGGSLANLTALLAARNRAFPSYWPDGAGSLAGKAVPAIAVGDDVHYSVSRAAGVIGIGEAQIVRLPLNERRQIRVDQAGAVLDAARERGLDVFCLVATAGTTSVGAFDPLEELADLARERGLWLHVDGAHGAGLLVSDAQRHKLAGIEKADSLAWDAHKMMFVPAPCTMLFYRDKATANGAFRQEASYVFDERPDVYAAFESGGRTLECTKRPMIMGLWVLWSVYGRSLIAEKIDHLCRLTTESHRIVAAEPDFEAPHVPEANILCLRYRPAGLPEAEVHRFQQEIRNRIRSAGRFFISQVDLDGVAALRVVLMNHEITAEHFRMLLEEIRSTGRELLADMADAHDGEEASRI